MSSEQTQTPVKSKLIEVHAMVISILYVQQLIHCNTTINQRNSRATARILEILTSSPQCNPRYPEKYSMIYTKCSFSTLLG